MARRSSFLPGKNHILTVFGVRNVFVLPGGEIVGNDRPQVQDAIAQGYYPGSEVKKEEDNLFCIGPTSQRVCWNLWATSELYKKTHRENIYSDFRLQWT